MENKAAKMSMVWTVVKEHVNPDGHRDERAIKHIGITDELKRQTILNSSVPLAELFLQLTFEDADLQKQVAKFNRNIDLHNDINVDAGRTSFYSRRRSIKYFSVSEFLTGYGIILGAADCLDKGNALFKTKKEESAPCTLWHSIAPKMDFSNYLSLSRFKQFRSILAHQWQDSEKFNENDPWWRFQKAIDEFNAIRKKFLTLGNITCLDESMVAWKPQTTFTGGLPNISHIDHKPEDIGCEQKTAASSGPLSVMRFIEVNKGKYYQERYE